MSKSRWYHYPALVARAVFMPWTLHFKRWEVVGGDDPKRFVRSERAKTHAKVTGGRVIDRA